MNSGTKSTISRLWNQSCPEDEIARILKLSIDDVTSYLKTRRGYPNGKIAKGDRVRTSTQPLRVADAQFGKHGPTPKPTLPKLKFLGEM